ncbi:hypothetical protein GBAR_LOCUS7408 [Geodia barretti]|uniref:Ig-like domain-containing protein n=1 Tax=Geodia barretti TaxID=519541 RepID=A0AA35RI86_GEOBA|nr:hypothetical protein GBAR_LOCUS7408 [Geodia barretti]
MALAVLLLLGLFWSLVYCQTFPYVSFMGQTLANHAYVDLSEVGNDLSGSDSVQCITDLSTCCSSAHGAHRGDWYFPNETRLHFYWNIRESRGDQSVFLRHQPDTPNSPTGIYLCDIPTIAVYDDRDISVRDTIYVGLYTGSGGSVSIAGGVTYDSNTQTLTCISTGGPATTVTWTRDSTTVTQGTNTVLNDPVTAQYTHTLTVTTAGEYTCTVANNKPSSASASTVVGGEMSANHCFGMQAKNQRTLEECNTFLASEASSSALRYVPLSFGQA